MKREQIFAYSAKPHRRKHGPRGYTDYQSLKPWLRDEFGFRCVYCLDREQFGSDGTYRFAVEHVRAKGGVNASPELRTNYENTVYACNRCNTLKGTHEIVDPTRTAFAALLGCKPDGVFEAITPEGQDVIDGLQLNDPRRVEMRRLIISVCDLAACEGSDRLLVESAHNLLKYPDDLPDLRTLRPPAGNTRPEGAQECYFVRREEGQLPDTY